MSGHLACTAMLSMSRHIATLNYLRSADTCLTRTRTVIYWLSVPAITDSANKCRIFDYHLNPKSLAASCYIIIMHYFRCNNYSIHNYDNAHEIVFCMNIAGGNECSRARCITFGAAYTFLRRAATCHVRTLLPGPEGVRS